MGRKKKILYIVSSLDRGGVDLAVYRMFLSLDPAVYDCTFCVIQNAKGDLEASITKCGAKIIHTPKMNYRQNYKYYLNLFRKQHFDAVHCHLPFFCGLIMFAAYKNGIPVRISHSHFSNRLIYDNDSKLREFLAIFYRVIMRSLTGKYSTKIIGCSREACEFISSKKYFKAKGMVLNNPVNTSEYEFNDEKRDRVRKKLNLDDKIVLGHIGHLSYVKNQSFLIDIFSDFHKKHKNSVLLIVGGGNDEKMLKNKASDLGIKDCVIFAGVRSDIQNLLLAMDCLVFPSLHEGFPLTLIEAQTSKLPCVVSSEITKSVKLSSALSFVSLSVPVSEWCSEIENMLELNRKSVDNKKVLEEFDIKVIGRKLNEVYNSADERNV